MSTAYDCMKKYFTENGWKFSERQEELSLGISFSGKNGVWTCLAQIDGPAHDRIVFYSICPVLPPRERFGVASEFIIRANHGMQVGNFDFDLDTGTILFRTSIDFNGQTPTKELVEPIVALNLIMMDTYLPGVMKIIADPLAQPSDVIDEVESSYHGDSGPE